MRPALARILRVPLTVLAVWAVLSVTVPIAMQHYSGYLVRPGIFCNPTTVRDGQPALLPPGTCQGLADLYRLPFLDLFVGSMFRSLALLVGAALLALVLGTLLGSAAALWRRNAFVGGGVIGVTALLSAIPAFFAAYFLQIFVIVVGATPTGGRWLPVYGFGYDEHLVLPLIAISLPAIAYTAQIMAMRMQEVLDADFITAATARGLRQSWILAVHVLPHVRPVAIEALGSGLRVSVASLPIVEFLFGWRGIGQLALEAVGVKDAAGLIFCAVVLSALFAILSAIADLSRPRALYRAA